MEFRSVLIDARLSIFYILFYLARAICVSSGNIEKLYIQCLLLFVPKGADVLFRFVDLSWARVPLFSSPRYQSTTVSGILLKCSGKELHI